MITYSNWSFIKFLPLLPGTDLVLGSCVGNLVTSFLVFQQHVPTGYEPLLDFDMCQQAMSHFLTLTCANRL